jgi:ADP-ribose pyrophosphatase
MNLIHPGVTILSDDIVWNGRFSLHVIKFRNIRFDGAESGLRTWELLCRGRAAAVLPYDPVTDQVVVIDQFRLPALAAGMDPVMTELCAGLCDGDDTAEATILRESQEEMGLEVHDLHRIGTFLLTPGGSEEHCTLFAGRVHVGETGPDGLMGYHGLAAENEDIRVRAVPAAHAIEAALEGAYPNSVTTIGLLWLAARRDWLRQRWR